MIANNVRHNLFLLAIFCLGVGAGLFFTRMNISREGAGDYFVTRNLYSAGGHLVNPLLEVESSQGNDARLEAAKYALNRYIDTCAEGRGAFAIAVYLMDLNKGTWIGINEEAQFTMASLVKVPIMMAYFKKAEQDPSVLDKAIMYETKVDVLPQNISPQNILQPGNAYKVNELLSHMIAHSDNTAMILLFQHIEKKLIDELCTDMRLPTPNLDKRDLQVSVRDYARSLRVLYSVTYLNKDSSEKALKLLTTTEFREGILAGIPSGMLVAHKFAERAYAQTETKELHECGIIYHPERPYMLCVMTKGRDFNSLKGVIKDISKIAYEHMEKKVVVL